MPAVEVTFRPIARADLPLLSRWLAEPLVARWWAHDPSPEAVEADFGPVLDGRDPTEVELACAGGRPFGLLQRYTFADNPEYLQEFAPVYPVPDGALSIDYLIGEPAMRGRGVGAAMIRRSWPRAGRGTRRRATSSSRWRRATSAPGAPWSGPGSPASPRGR